MTFIQPSYMCKSNPIGNSYHKQLTKHNKNYLETSDANDILTTSHVRKDELLGIMP